MASKVGFLGFTVLIVVVLAATNTNGVSADGCEGDLRGLTGRCAPYVLKMGPKIRPSRGCCDVVRKVDIPCVCRQVTPEIEKLVSIKKVLYVAQFCGKNVPHGTKCGSVTTPSAMKRN
ncbi:protein LIM3-like [Papaver somniferum]|uniref:protein LIM3-like n=1 Tax=Papaver somniferum TaxID=3469 RepID=UPI000E6F9E47|nr:protein LIM3-like [Papaver somniferum]